MSLKLRSHTKKRRPALHASMARFILPVVTMAVFGVSAVQVSLTALAHKQDTIRQTALSTQQKSLNSTTRPKTDTHPPSNSPTPTPPPTPTPTKTPAPTPPPAPSTPPPVSAAATTPGKKVSSLAPASSPPPAQSASTPTATPTPTQPPGGQSVTTGYTSTNWAGYAAMSGGYSSVSGSWTATSPTGNGTSTSADAAWIGIGGINGQDLIQVGTENTVSASGQVSTAVFYELLPALPVYPSSIPISPGDSISASITEISAGRWAITITDSTRSETFSTTVSYTSSHASAEWIQEDPSYASGGLVPFDFFGSISFTGAAATANGSTVSLTSGNALPITLLDASGSPAATPTSIGSDGASFRVVRN